MNNGNLSQKSPSWKVYLSIASSHSDHYAVLWSRTVVLLHNVLLEYLAIVHQELWNHYMQTFSNDTVIRWGCPPCLMSSTLELHIGVFSRKWYRCSSKKQTRKFHILIHQSIHPNNLNKQLSIYIFIHAFVLSFICSATISDLASVHYSSRIKKKVKIWPLHTVPVCQHQVSQQWHCGHFGLDHFLL